MNEPIDPRLLGVLGRIVKDWLDGALRKTMLFSPHRYGPRATIQVEGDISWSERFRAARESADAHERARQEETRRRLNQDPA